MAFAHRPDDPLRAQETPIEKLIEARERTDAGMRLALPILMQDDEPEAAAEQDTEPARVDHDDAKQVAAELLTMRESAIRAGAALPLKGNLDLHLALNGIVNEVDRIGGELAERWGDG